MTGLNSSLGLPGPEPGLSFSNVPPWYLEGTGWLKMEGEAAAANLKEP